LFGLFLLRLAERAQFGQLSALRRGAWRLLTKWKMRYKIAPPTMSTWCAAG